MANIDVLLKKAAELKVSDVHVAVSARPMVRQFGELRQLQYAPLTAAQTQALLFEILTPPQRRKFDAEMELDFAYEIPGVGRFRANAFQQRKGIDMCFRLIPDRLPSLDELGLPDTLRQACDHHQGLILITGGAGSGKSTTLAAMVDLINSTRAHHVLTVEEPIEFVHPLKMGAVNQREIGRHTLSYANALRAALRENPDVIMVGELRDLETISLAISASETGHLVLGSMNTSSCHKTVDKIIDSYPAGQQNQIRAMLGESLKVVFTQRLVPRSDGAGRVLVCEILLGSLQLANLIKEEKTFQIPNLMQTGKARGMRTMDDSLLALLDAGTIQPAVALRNCSNPKLFTKWSQAAAGSAA